MARLNCYPEKRTKNILDKLVKANAFKNLGNAVDNIVFYYCKGNQIDVDKLLVTDFSVQLPHVKNTME